MLCVAHRMVSVASQADRTREHDLCRSFPTRVMLFCLSVLTFVTLCVYCCIWLSFFSFQFPFPSLLFLRIGRSGRFGRKGVAINFVKQDDIRILRDIEQYYGTQIDELPMNGLSACLLPLLRLPALSLTLCRLWCLCFPSCRSAVSPSVRCVSTQIWDFDSDCALLQLFHFVNSWGWWRWTRTRSTWQSTNKLALLDLHELHRIFCVCLFEFGSVYCSALLLIINSGRGMKWWRRWRWCRKRRWRAQIRCVLRCWRSRSRSKDWRRSRRRSERRRKQGRRRWRWRWWRRRRRTRWWW